MIDSDAITQAIQQHGARAVYAAANRAFSDRAALAVVGLEAANMGDVHAIQCEAYRQLGEADKAIDHASALSRL